MEDIFNKEFDSKTVYLKKNNKKKFLFVGVFGIFILLSLIVAILSLFKIGYTSSNLRILKLKNFKQNEAKVIGEIICKFDVTNKNTQIFSKDFNKSSNFNIYIDEMPINYTKEYDFTNFGIHNLKIELYEDLNMDNMFKDIKDLISIEMNSKENCKILSMKSTFESAENLEFFNITGFDATELKSTSKCFYETNLNSYYFNSFDSKNLEDISYMFSLSNIEEFSLNGLNVNNVKNMSHFLDECVSLVEFNDNDFNTSNVIDMSYMFSNCVSLENLNLKNFITKNVESTSGLFSGCRSLKSIDISNFILDKNKNMSYMFEYSSRVEKIEFGKINTENVEDMAFLFNGY